MFKKIIAASVVAIALSASAAQAKSHHVYHRHHTGHRYSLGGFIRGHNICAINVNAVLRRLGLRHTNSPSARSFITLPKTSHPRSGDVMMVRRSGGSGYHVAIVHGNGTCQNPSSIQQGWTYPKCADIWKGHARFFVSTH